jgi:hypothetical protein
MLAAVGLHGRIAWRFKRLEARERVRHSLDEVERKNRWQPGEAHPAGV